MPYRFTGRKCVRIAHHISGIWSPQPSEDPLKAGSRGAGVLVSPYLNACLEGEGEGLLVDYKGSQPRMRPLEILASRLPSRDAMIRIDLTLPPGRGYATSAASSIGYALLANWLAGGSLIESFQLAHEAEVRALTGLGDVASITLGRMLNFRWTAGPPPEAVVDSYPVPSSVVVASFSLGSMDTRDMLASAMEVFRREGERSLLRLEREPGFEVFLEEARRFSRATGQLRGQVENAVVAADRSCGGCVLGYFVKKTLLVVFVEKGWATELPSLLSSQGVFFEYSHLHRVVGEGVLLGPA